MEKSLEFYVLKAATSAQLLSEIFFQAVKSYFISSLGENIQSQTEKSQNSLTLALHELSYSFFQGERRRAEVHRGRNK